MPDEPRAPRTKSAPDTVLEPRGAIALQIADLRDELEAKDRHLHLLNHSKVLDVVMVVGGAAFALFASGNLRLGGIVVLVLGAMTALVGPIGRRRVRGQRQLLLDRLEEVENETRDR